MPVTGSPHVPPVPYGDMPRKAWKTIGGLTEGDLGSVREGMQLAQDVEGVAYSSEAEFIRDALRRRLASLKEAYRDAHAVRERLGMAEPKRKKEG